MFGNGYTIYILVGVVVLAIGAWALMKFIKRPVSDLLMQKADALVNSGNYDEAIALYEKAINTYKFKSGTPAVCWSNIAQCRLDKKEWDLAHFATEWSLKLNSNNPIALAVDARAWFEQGEYQKAIDTAYKKIKLMPDDPNAYSLLAVSYAKLGNKTEANKAVGEAEQRKYAGLNELRRMVKEELSKFTTAQNLAKTAQKKAKKAGSADTSVAENADAAATEAAVNAEKAEAAPIEKPLSFDDLKGE